MATSLYIYRLNKAPPQFFMIIIVQELLGETYQNIQEDENICDNRLPGIAGWICFHVFYGMIKILSCVCEWKLPLMFHVILHQDSFTISKDSWVVCNLWDLSIEVFSIGSLCRWVSTPHGSECCPVLGNAWIICYSTFSINISIGNEMVSVRTWSVWEWD